jgi:hypothetical protein
MPLHIGSIGFQLVCDVPQTVGKVRLYCGDAPELDGSHPIKCRGVAQNAEKIGINHHGRNRTLRAVSTPQTYVTKVTIFNPRALAGCEQRHLFWIGIALLLLAGASAALMSGVAAAMARSSMAAFRENSGVDAHSP